MSSIKQLPGDEAINLFNSFSPMKQSEVKGKYGTSYSLSKKEWKNVYQVILEWLKFENYIHNQKCVIPLLINVMIFEIDGK